MKAEIGICLSQAKCRYLILNKGFTNLNQKEEKSTYLCGVGKFSLHRDPNLLPAKCSLYKEKDLVKIVDVPTNEPLQAPEKGFNG